MQFEYFEEVERSVSFLSACNHPAYPILWKLSQHMVYMPKMVCLFLIIQYWEFVWSVNDSFWLKFKNIYLYANRDY